MIYWRIILRWVVFALDWMRISSTDSEKILNQIFLIDEIVYFQWWKMFRNFTLAQPSQNSSFRTVFKKIKIFLNFLKFPWVLIGWKDRIPIAVQIIIDRKYKCLIYLELKKIIFLWGTHQWSPDQTLHINLFDNLFFNHNNYFRRLNLMRQSARMLKMSRFSSWNWIKLK